VDLAKTVVTQLATTGHVVRGYLGVSIQPMNAELAKGLGVAETSGALVSSVVGGSPAAKAGVKPGDVITEYNGRKVARAEDLPRAVAESAVGREVPLTVVRDGKPVTLRASIARLDDTDAPAARGAKGTKENTSALGLSLQPITPAEARERGLGDRGGVIVRDVRDGSPAASAGLRPGDVISEINRAPIKTADDVKQAMDRRVKDKPALFLVHRNGGSVYVAVNPDA
jgi:serine protease Do